MKKIGYLLIIVGLAILGFVLYTFFSRRNGLISPIPEDKGVKVIFVTPGQDE